MYTSVWHFWNRDWVNYELVIRTFTGKEMWAVLGTSSSKMLSTAQLFACPECGTSTPEVIQGKELEVVALEVVDMEVVA